MNNIAKQPDITSKQICKFAYFCLQILAFPMILLWYMFKLAAKTIAALICTVIIFIIIGLIIVAVLNAKSYAYDSMVGSSYLGNILQNIGLNTNSSLNLVSSLYNYTRFL